MSVDKGRNFYYIRHMASFLYNGSNYAIPPNKVDYTAYIDYNAYSIELSMRADKMNDGYCIPSPGNLVKVDEISTWVDNHKDLVKYQFFGSEDSLDVDVMFFLQEMPNVADCKKIADCLKFFLGLKYCDVNLCTVRHGIVTGCYKGSIDEVNNMLINTYELHKQPIHREVYKHVPRLVNEKAERAIRGILSHLSRTEHRKEIKKALGNFERSIEVLEIIDLSKVDNLNKNNSNLVLFYKFFATQVGQLMGLYDGVELYTKHDISKRYPGLKKLLYREQFDVRILENIKTSLLKHIEFYDKEGILYPSKYISSINGVSSTTGTTSVNTSANFNFTNITTNSIANIMWSVYAGNSNRIMSTLTGGFSVNDNIEDIISYDVDLIKSLNEENKRRK